jgi:Arc/MetJ-type ribon-helix-helix transcriptional regulator
MTTEMISLKLDSKFLKEIDDVVERQNYLNRTEFIRDSLRKNVDEAKMKEAMALLAPMKGASKRKTSDEDLERAREIVSQRIEKEIQMRSSGLK